MFEEVTSRSWPRSMEETDLISVRADGKFARLSTEREEIEEVRNSDVAQFAHKGHGRFLRWIEP